MYQNLHASQQTASVTAYTTVYLPQWTNRLKLARKLVGVEKVQYKRQILLVTTTERRKHRRSPISRLFRPMSTELDQQPTSIENCYSTIHLQQHKTADTFIHSFIIILIKNRQNAVE